MEVVKKWIASQKIFENKDVNNCCYNIHLESNQKACTATSMFNFFHLRSWSNTWWKQKDQISSSMPYVFLAFPTTTRFHTFHSGRLRLKCSSLHVYLHGNISADNCVRELFKPSKDSTSLCICNEKKMVLGFFEWRRKWSCFRPTSSGPRPKPLDGSISFKFLLETKLKSESFDILINLLGFLVQKLWYKIK